jgi:hypothetical protein
MGVLAPNKRRGTEDMGDMVRSLAVVFVVILVVGVYFLFGRPHPNPVHVVDGGPVLRAAQASAPYHVLVPVALGPGWRLTSARDTTEKGHVVGLHLGYVTPKGDFAEVEETGHGPGTSTAVSLGNHVRRLAPVTVAGTRWDRSLVGRDTALVRSTDDGATVVVRGTASLDELEALATSLR